jgi:riboflavin transporter FmnP
MKKEFIYGIIKGAVFLLIGFALFSIIWSMKNVVITLTGDAMRVFVVVAAYSLSIPLYLQYLLFAVRKKDHTMLYLSAGAALIALAIGVAFVLVDYSMNMFNTFDAMDTRRSR